LMISIGTQTDVNLVSMHTQTEQPYEREIAVSRVEAETQTTAEVMTEKPNEESKKRKKKRNDDEQNKQPTSLKATNKILESHSPAREPSKLDKIYVVGSSNARDISGLLNNKLGDRFSITGTCIPNGTIDQIIETTSNSISKLSENDYIIVFAGFNDIAKTGHRAEVEKFLQIDCKAKIIFAELRYTCKRNYNLNYNLAIDATNKYLSSLHCEHPDKFSILTTRDMGTELSTDGIHLKKKGKLILANRLLLLLDNSQTLSPSSRMGDDVETAPLPIPVVDSANSFTKQVFRNRPKRFTNRRYQKYV